MAERTSEREVGKTRDTGWQIGVRRTMPLSVEEAWELVTSAEGMGAWLGGEVEMERGKGFALADGASGEVRVMKPRSHLRLTWQPGGWKRASTIQVRVLPAAGGATIAFHQEHLPDAEARERRHAHFAAALDALARIAGEDG
ncbi:MAG TPA: SRPBCC domain-containing protein [Longimicrobium sp.]|jgi:uncharacterized protein YndB with AHSA1/START domain